MALVVVEVGLERTDVELVFEFEDGVGDAALGIVYWSEGLIVLRNCTEVRLSYRLGYMLLVVLGCIANYYYLLLNQSINYSMSMNVHFGWSISK